MTNDLAIKILMGDVLGTTEQTHEAVAMAVKALSALPSADAVEVVRCKDCKWYRPHSDAGTGYCYMAEWYTRYQYDDDFCSRGEQRDG